MARRDVGPRFGELLGIFLFVDHAARREANLTYRSGIVDHDETRGDAFFGEERGAPAGSR